MLRISHALTLDKVIHYNFVHAIRYSFVPARKEEQFCTCTVPKLYRYSVNAREKEHFCIGSKVIWYSVNAALIFLAGAPVGSDTFISFLCNVVKLRKIGSVATLISRLNFSRA